MRIGMDIRPLIFTRAGVHTYVYELVKALCRVPEDELVLYTNAPTGIDWREVGGKASEACVRMSHRFKVLEMAWERFLLPAAVRSGNIDIFHGPRFWTPALSCPSVTTIHDCAFRLFPDVVAGSTRDMFDKYVVSSLARCACVIVPSQITKRDLVRLYSADERRICVVPEAASADFQAYTDRSAGSIVCGSRGIEGRFILTVGTREPRKNFPFLLEAYSRLPGRSRVKLVVTGGRGWLTDSLKDTVRKLGLSRDVVFTGYVPVAELVWLYNCCELFVFPSLYEGFGLPVLEAMQCGAPVVSSGAGAVEEWLGGAFEPADPHDPESFARTVDSVLSDRDRKEKLVRAGLEASKKFSWSRTAKLTREVYRKAMEKL